jgi:hypothetical protein
MTRTRAVVAAAAFAACAAHARAVAAQTWSGSGPSVTVSAVVRQPAAASLSLSAVIEPADGSSVAGATTRVRRERWAVGGAGTGSDAAMPWEIGVGAHVRRALVTLVLPDTLRVPGAAAPGLAVDWEGRAVLALCEPTRSGCDPLVGARVPARASGAAFEYRIAGSPRPITVRMLLGAGPAVPAPLRTGTYAGTALLLYQPLDQ